MHKKCSRCLVELEVSEFYLSTRSNDGYQSRCKKCHKVYRDGHYKNNRQKYIDKAKTRTASEREWWKEYKGQFSCICCGEKESCCLDFHHLEGKDKKYNIAAMATRESREKILEELKKTVPVCANCHRKIHAGVISVNSQPATLPK